MRVIFLLAFLFPFMLLAQDLAAERKLYAVAHMEAQASMELQRLMDGAENSGPAQMAYRGASLMVASQFAEGPGKKLKLFKEGKELMTKAIEEDPESVEIHFLRMTVQENAPGILKYHDELQGDKEFILAHFPTLKDIGLKKIIRDHARGSTVYSEEERSMLMSIR